MSSALHNPIRLEPGYDCLRVELEEERSFHPSSLREGIDAHRAISLAGQFGMHVSCDNPEDRPDTIEWLLSLVTPVASESLLSALRQLSNLELGDLAVPVIAAGQIGIGRELSLRGVVIPCGIDVYVSEPIPLYGHELLIVTLERKIRPLRFIHLSPPISALVLARAWPLPGRRVRTLRPSDERIGRVVDHLRLGEVQSYGLGQ